MTKHVGRLAFALALAGLLPCCGASAQSAAELGDIAEKIAAFGKVIDPPNTGKLYAPFQKKEPYAGVKVERDIKYGADAKQAIDVFLPEQPAAGGRPVLIYVRGGAFIAGDKRPPGSPFYDNMMLWAVANGMAGVNVNYRLAPAHTWPAGAEDVGAVVRWVEQNASSLGADQKRIFLMGHSAGAAHVGSYVAHAKFHGVQGHGLAGVILVSGVYDFTLHAGDNEKAYFGADASLYAERSSVSGIVKLSIPVLVAHAELDPAFFVPQAVGLKDALCKAGRCPTFVALAKHSHMSEVHSINTTDDSLTKPLLAFIRAAK